MVLVAHVVIAFLNLLVFILVYTKTSRKYCADCREDNTFGLFTPILIWPYFCFLEYPWRACSMTAQFVYNSSESTVESALTGIAAVFSFIEFLFEYVFESIVSFVEAVFSPCIEAVFGRVDSVSAAVRRRLTEFKSDFKLKVSETFTWNPLPKGTKAVGNCQ